MANNTKEKIRQQAISLFKENGYENVTVLQICKAAGITKRTFYYHFSSKDEIIHGILGHVAQQIELMSEAMLHQESHVGIIWAMMRGYAVEAEETGAGIISQFYINILQRGATDKFPQDMMLFKAVVNNIANAQLAGEIGNMQSPEDVAYALYHTLRSVAYTWCRSGGNDSLMDEYKHAFQSVLQILLPPDKAFGADA